MTAGEPPPPHHWDTDVNLSKEASRMFQDVANGIEKNQTVVWKNAVSSMQHVNQNLETSPQARYFMEHYMMNVISILVEQQPAKIGTMEKGCVEDSLEIATSIISKELAIQLKTENGECKVLDVLGTMLSKKKAYFKGSKNNWSSHLNGLPEVRMRLIDKFRMERGFSYLAEYLSKHANTPQFPTLDVLHPILVAIADGLPSPTAVERQVGSKEAMEKDAIHLATAVIEYFGNCTDEQLKKVTPEALGIIRNDLHFIFDHVIVRYRQETSNFYEFWRNLTLKLMTSQSLPLKLCGWDQATFLIEAAASHRPPPKSFRAVGAGTTFVNGEYVFKGTVTADGYCMQHADVSYVRKIPEEEKDGGGKTLTIFRCTMRSGQKWWFLSEADEEQPGTDRDIDYYQHKSKEHEEQEPPSKNWITCRTGIDPSPVLRGEGLMVPPGEEYNTMEHQLARWAIENGIVELVLGDSLHREIVARSTSLIKFLASMCERDEPVDGYEGSMKPNAYGLQDSHLVLAWKTCTSKADSAVSTEIYQLLVSILPSLSSEMAVTLLSNVQMSLEGSTEKRDFLPEVAEFCSALAASTPVDNKTGQVLGLEGISEKVRREILHLMWSLLTHPDASSLKSYDHLKRYVAHELRLEPAGTEHREYFLKSCTGRLSKNTRRKPGSGAVDELHVLRTVKLTQFVLEACPHDQKVAFVSVRDGKLPSLLFDELIAYMARRNADLTMSLAQKRTGAGEVKHDVVAALSQRLDILRFVYGISDHVKLSLAQLQHLWQLCTIPSDREALMMFVADASGSDPGPAPHGPALAEPQPVHAQLNKPQQAVVVEPLVAAAFSDSVRTSAFLDLFCSMSVNWGELGEGAYRSFQSMFKKLRQSPEASIVTTAQSLDALWRICLNAGNDVVASEAMKDLLAVYTTMAGSGPSQNAWADDRMSPTGSDSMTIDSTDDSFGNRVFQCLVEVKKGLEAGTASSERSAERCLRILNAAVSHDGSSGRSVSASGLEALSTVSTVASLPKAMARLPHGMRGQSCYRRIQMYAKRTPMVPGTTLTTPGVERKENISIAGPKAAEYRFTLYVHPLETIASIKEKIAQHCDCPLPAIKNIFINGGRRPQMGNRSQGNDPQPMNLNFAAEDSVVDQLGIVHGCGITVLFGDQPIPVQNKSGSTKRAVETVSALNVSEIFQSGGEFADRLFETLLGVLELLPWRETEENGLQVIDSHNLVWDLLLAMPTNSGIIERVRATSRLDGVVSSEMDKDAMVVDTPLEQWSDLLDRASFHHSVYVMQVIESFLQPAPEALTTLPSETRSECIRALVEDAASFRKAFISSGGFDAVVRWFSVPANDRSQKQSERRMGNAVALRILKCCLFGISQPVVSADAVTATVLDEPGKHLLRSLTNVRELLTSLASMVVLDDGIASATILDVLRFLWLLFGDAKSTEIFVSLPNGLAESFLVTLLLWEGGPDSMRTNTIAHENALKIRGDAHDLILKIPSLATHSLPWLTGALNDIDVTSDTTSEYFDVLRHLVERQGIQDQHGKKSSGKDLRELGTAVCQKLLSCPRPTNDSALIDFSTGVLCGCLSLLRAIIETGGSNAIKAGTNILLDDLKIIRWSEQTASPSSGVLQRVSSSFARSRPRPDDAVLIDLMGAVFDGFLSPGGSSSVVAICCDEESRSLGFDAVATAARSCQGHDGYVSLIHRINGIVKAAEPHLRHRWNQNGGGGEGHSRSHTHKNTATYSGLRNQGCTCYMNSFLQQMFMMTDLRERMCSAPIPASLRTSGGSFAKGAELIGKKISVQWDSGISYDAEVEGYDAGTKMHTIRYCPMPVATVGGSGHQQVHPDEISLMPPELSEEFFLSEGRPGKETGVFEIIEAKPPTAAGEGTSENGMLDKRDEPVKETEDESSSRHLLEEVQRTFIHLDEGSRGRCFDPRALVEACACLKLEFDVWQQNDASEFAMKLLDRMEIALKKWAPDQFRYLDHTFGLKQTKQKVCKECGLKTNREENLMNIDCQIRQKSDIHEALATMCEVELMEGNNKVFCDRCKKNTDTVLKTAISALPDMLILSLKRFDLDYTTFETVKLNSRCEFGQTLNMKRYTLEAADALEKAGLEAEMVENADGIPMETDEDDAESVPVDPLSSLPDEDYEYKLVGVLVHAGVAQGGHYYSFIKDRTPDADADKWYRFDDEDVTPFDPTSIEDECFGGVITKDPKWAGGTAHTQERFANALMLFYEKVKPAKKPEQEPEVKEKVENAQIVKTTGYDVFTPDVRQSNATHRWQTFLFDSEFQSFLQGLLNLCQRSCSAAGSSETGSVRHIRDSSWRDRLVDMLISFFFDVLLYSAQRTSVNDWVLMLSDIFKKDGETAKRFVLSLAERTRTVSSNWLRTYLTDCPEQDARIAAVRVFNAGIQACAAYTSEQDALRKWSIAWKSQAKDIQAAGGQMPTRLKGRWQELESFTSSKVSTIGIILSFLTRLLEVAPRTWRYNADLCLLIRDLSNARPEYGGIFLREAMEAAEFPALLACLVTRHQAAMRLRSVFPGVSASMAATESQSRPETNPSAHLTQMGSGQSGPDRVSRHPADGQPSARDLRTVFEAIGCLIGVKGIVHDPLVVEVPETTDAPKSIVISKQLEDALSTVFTESCSNPAGMGQHEIEQYWHMFSHDRSSTHKIAELVTKYSSNTDGNLPKSNLLSREGFIAYYKELAKNYEMKVRSDLHSFGYRPDLSRRSRESRITSRGHRRHSTEGVAMDIHASVDELSREEPFSSFTRAALPNFALFAYSFGASVPMTEHLLITGVYLWEEFAYSLIVSTLSSFYMSAYERWRGGDESWNASLRILKTIAAIQDEKQHERIAMMMSCDAKGHQNSEYGVGLLIAPQEVHPNSRRHNHDTRYIYEAYIRAIQELIHASPPCKRFMAENRSLWNWFASDLFPNREEVSSRQPARVDYSRRDDTRNTTPIMDGSYGQSDSDMFTHSDDEEEDYDDEGDQYFDHKVLVQGAGLDVVNGEYKITSRFDNVGKYTRVAPWQHQDHEFSLFRCNTSNGAKHWYISIVPLGVQPGTSTDIDFYSAAVSTEEPNYPPPNGWSTASEGKGPPPTVSMLYQEEPAAFDVNDLEKQQWGGNRQFQA